MGRHSRPANRRAQFAVAFVVAIAIVVVIIGFTGRGTTPSATSKGQHLSATPTTAVSAARSSPAATASADQGPALAPVHIAIPLIHVDAAVVPVGTGSLSVLLSPGNDTAVGWYSKGSTPGTDGTAFLTALEGRSGHPGLFDRLRYLPVGTAISITDEQGHVRTFRVTGRKSTMRNDPRAVLLSTGTLQNGAPLIVLLAVPPATPHPRPQANVVVVAAM